MNSHSKIEGTQFEMLLEKAAQFQNVHIIRMPDGCRSLGRNKLIRVKTPFDFVLVYKGISVFLDCKSFDSDRITYSQLTDHQVKALYKIESRGCNAGYIIWMRREKSVFFARASQLAELMPHEHIHAKDMIFLGDLDPEKLSMEKFYLGRLFSIQLERKPLTLTGGLN